MDHGCGGNCYEMRLTPHEFAKYLATLCTEMDRNAEVKVNTDDNDGCIWTSYTEERICTFVNYNGKLDLVTYYNDWEPLFRVRMLDSNDDAIAARTTPGHLFKLWERQ